MNGAQELELLIRALRIGAIDPKGLADAAIAWPAGQSGFVRHLVDRGVLDRIKLHSMAPSTATYAVGGTPDFDPLGTKDYSGAGGAHPGDTPSMLPAVGSSPQSEEMDGLERFSNRYQLMKVHRIGGLGEVWLARDVVIGRDVAVKTIRIERQGDAATRARFLREARLTGRLEHPSIVPLYDLLDPSDGCAPYYAMRFVAGRTLAEVISEYHAARKAGKATRLGLVTLLDAFVTVCRAVAFAHFHKILHRDLKGPNVVIGDYGEVFLLDWGLAKEVHESDLPGSGQGGGGGEADSTSPGSIMGTPAFMAPELVAGSPASRSSDTYALGAILHVILAGQTPYEGSNDEVLEKVKTSEPPPPHATNPAAPPALEAICRKAMARDPQARYASADDLATDVRRWLADEPVEVYRDPWTVRAARWARRHRTPVAATLAFLLTAILALLVTTALVWREKEQTAAQKNAAEREWERAEGERARAEQEKTRAEQQKSRADQHAQTARTLIVDVSRRLGALETGSGNPRQADQERQRALEAATAAFEGFRADLPEDVVLQKQTAAIHRYSANVSRLLLDTTAAEKSYRAALELTEDLARRFPQDASSRDTLAQTLRDYGTFLKRMGKLSEALKSLKRSIELAEGLKGEIPESAYRRTLGTSMLDRSGVDYLRGDYASAESAARKAIELLDGLRDAPKGEETWLDPLLTAIAVNDLARAQREAGRTADALETSADAVARFKILTAKSKDNRDVAFNQALARLEQARTWTAFPHCREAARQDLDGVLVAMDRLVGNFPYLPAYREEQAEAYLRRGELHAAMRNREGARNDFQKAEDLFKELNLRYPQSPDYPGWRGFACLGLSRILVEEGHLLQAVKLLDKTGRLLAQVRVRNPDNALYKRGVEELGRVLNPAKP